MNFSDRSILGKLNADFQQHLLSIAEERRLVPGDLLCEAQLPFEGAYLLVEGSLDETHSPNGLDRNSEPMTPGALVDELNLLTGGLYSRTLVATEPSRLLFFQQERFRTLVADNIPLLEELSSLVSEHLKDNQVNQILTRLFGDMEKTVRDFINQQLEWMILESGQTLFRKSDPGNALYALIDGSMAAYAEEESGQIYLNEILPGETIGEIAIITGEVRSATVKATKRSLLISLDRDHFDAIAEKHPIIYKAFAKVLVTWLQRSRDRDYMAKYAREIVLIAHKNDPDLMFAVATRLETALSKMGETLHLGSTTLKEIGAKYLFDVRKAMSEPLYHPDNTRFRLWLEEQKQRYKFIVYVTDGDGQNWDKLCVDRAHEILIVANKDDDPEASLAEAELKDDELVPRRLALVYLDDSEPKDTSRWLVDRQLAGHHHIRANRDSDFERLARFLAGKAIGLVLAGGGARGFAHIGIIHAIHELGVPIDIIGGTSSGGMISLTYAMDTDSAKLEQRNQEEWIARKPLGQLAVPVLSLLDHTKWDRIYQDSFADRHIEDLWIPAFCVSCNLDTGQTVVHESGIAWKASRATASLPVILAPVLFDGQGHVDGGVVNNLPTDIMRQRTKGPVFASSLGYEPPEKLTMDAYPSPWKLLLEKLPGLKGRKLEHTAPTVIMRLVTMQDQAAFGDRAKLADFMFMPNVSKYSMTDLGFTDEIVEMGQAYGQVQLREWLQDETFVERLGSSGIKLPG